MGRAKDEDEESTVPTPPRSEPGAEVIELSPRRLVDVEPEEPPSDFALQMDSEVLYPEPLPSDPPRAMTTPQGRGPAPRVSSDLGIIIEPPVAAYRSRGPVLVASQDPWAVSILTGRKVDVIASTGIDSALALATQIAPSVMVVALQLSDGSAFDLLDVLAGQHAPFEAVVILRPDQWDYAQACFAAGAAEVIEHGDTEHLLAVLSGLAAVDRGVENRAEVQVPISVQVSGYSWNLETLDLRATGIAVRGVPPLEKGATVRLILNLLGRRMDLRGQLTRSWDDRGTSCAAFRFVGLAPDQREFMRAAVGEYGGHKVEDALVHSWRREIRSIVGTFDSNRHDSSRPHGPSVVHTLTSTIHRPTKVVEDAEPEKHPGWHTGTIDFESDDWDERIKRTFRIMLVVVLVVGGALAVLHLLEWLLTSK